jgi:hypothetical protein
MSREKGKSKRPGSAILKTNLGFIDLLEFRKDFFFSVTVS